MAYESKGTFYEFPHSEFNEEHPQIYHTNLCCSFNGTNGYGMYIDARGRNQWKEKYSFEENEDQIVVARLEITELPNEWKEKMGDSWFYWLDTLDDDYAVISKRADRIVKMKI